MNHSKDNNFFQNLIKNTMKNYLITEVQNIVEIQNPEHTLEVKYILADGSKKNMGRIPCGGRIPVELGFSGQAQELTVLLSAANETATVCLREPGSTGTGFQAQMNGESWTDYDNGGEAGGFPLAIPLPNGAEGILVIGTVDIED